MVIEKRLYSLAEVKQLIKDIIHDLVLEVGQLPDQSPELIANTLQTWGNKMLLPVEELVAEEVARRHVIGVTFAVWTGPPGSGKGTNIAAINLLCQAYAEYTSQGGARILLEPFHSKLLDLSTSRAHISTGTKGMFNRPEGEYAELFTELQGLTGAHVARGGFVPDNVTSVLVELMILHRLVQGFHKVQIDVWPRTQEQSRAYMSLVAKISQNGGKIKQELVDLRVIAPENMMQLEENLQEFADISKQIGSAVATYVLEPAFVQAVSVIASDLDPLTKYSKEKELLTQVFFYLEAQYPDQKSQLLIQELKEVCKRMEYRFFLALKKEGAPRAGEYPLAVIKRLAIYACDSSPAFLEMAQKQHTAMPIKQVSAYGTPAEVVARILRTIIGDISTDNVQWERIVEFGGTLAAKIVSGDSPIVDETVVAVGGIFSSEKV